MLVVTRKKRQTIVIEPLGCHEPLLLITVLEITGGRVQIGFTTASTIPIHRGEVWEALHKTADGQSLAHELFPGLFGSTADGDGAGRAAAHRNGSAAPRSMRDVVDGVRTRREPSLTIPTAS